MYYYTVTHLTLFTYSEAITDSVMQLCMRPVSEGNQRCVSFRISISPRARTSSYRDYLGNTFHVFDIPGRHQKLAIKTESAVELRPLPLLPDSLDAGAWQAIDRAAEDPNLYDMILPSHFAQQTPLLRQLASELSVNREADPLSTLKGLNAAIYENFAYSQNVTRVDSPIDDALEARRGVCQDFTHIMIALGRGLGIPCRYVSGYLYHRKSEHDRSAEDASHAWLEAWLPGLGWVGFDPTNNLMCQDRHIRVGVGRDYADIPPSKGVFKGEAESTLEVKVNVGRLDELPLIEENFAPEIQMPRYEMLHDQEQQQQQQ